MKIQYKSLFTFCILFVSMLNMSCKNKVEKSIIGWWTIDTLRYGDYGDIRNCVSSIIIFNSDGTCDLQSIYKYCYGLEASDEKGTWNIIFTDTVPVQINIKSNKIFNGLHEVYFNLDKGLLRMSWVSHTLYMVCHKGMYDVNRNARTVRYLEQYTNKVWENGKK